MNRFSLAPKTFGEIGSWKVLESVGKPWKIIQRHAKVLPMDEAGARPLYFYHGFGIAVFYQVRKKKQRLWANGVCGLVAVACMPKCIAVVIPSGYLPLGSRWGRLGIEYYNVLYGMS